MYATEALGVDGYLIARERTKAQIPNPEKFRAKMLEFVCGKYFTNGIFFSTSFSFRSKILQAKI